MTTKAPTTKEMFQTILDNENKILAAVTSTPVTTPSAPSSPTNPITPSPTSFYVHSNTASVWASSSDPLHPDTQAVMTRIVPYATGTWLAEWCGDIATFIKNLYTDSVVKGGIPLLISYYAMDRDNGGQSAGGATSVASYLAWVKAMAMQIANNIGYMIVEPDALGLPIDSSIEQVSGALTLYKQYCPNLKVFLDASFWVDPTVMAQRLQQAGIAQADGFSMNVSNFRSTAELITICNKISAIVGKPYIIDTSRNGNGPTPDSQWCNPSGRALGHTPQINPDPANKNLLVYVWAKVPGESDGNCNGVPSAGTFWPAYALGLCNGNS